MSNLIRGTTLGIERLIASATGLLSLFVLLLVTASPAHAGVGIGITPTFLPSVKVGQTGLSGAVQIAWANTFPNDTHGNNITGITLVPACGAFVASSDCPAAPTDYRLPGILSVSTSGTGSGAGCGGVSTFTLTVIDAASGKIGITPGFTLPVGGVCTINFTFGVNALPTKDANASRSGVQVAVLGGASATDAVNSQPGGGLGSAEISFPVISTTPGAGGTLGLAPVNLSDTATMMGLVPDNNNFPPTGTVTFNLYRPSDPTCAGAAFQSQVVNLTSCTINGTSFLTNCATSNTFTANAAGVWHWSATYSGNALNQSMSHPCAAEPVTVNKANPTLQTTPNPTSGTLLATPLGDVADLQGGFQPTGTITFRLYPPTDANCVGTESFINTVAVNGNGIYSTSVNYQKANVNQVGTWHWKANYSGDANNSAAASQCADEPVTITKPVLSIAKTPDGGTINEGATATFTIVVTNLGPGVAKDVTMSDPLPAGGGVNWTTSTAGCIVTGAVGAQTLSCILGVNFNEGATFTAVVKAVTSAGHCEAMNNTATAVSSNASQVSNPGSITCIPKGNPTLTTTPNPASGTMLATPLGDTANLAGGNSPTGSIVFRLYSPSDPNCVGPENFINTVQVNGNGNYSTSLNYQKANVNQVGTWHWKANYSGDTLNNPAASPCAAEPVVITKPALSIVKTPDNGTINAGQTATFTMVVTNLGPGVAKTASISDILPAGGGVNWQTVTPGCVITGAVGSQTLTCLLGVNFDEGATFTAVVTALTDSGHCTVMNNTALAQANNASQVSDTGQITCIAPCDVSLEKTCSLLPVTAYSCSSNNITALTMSWGGPGTIWVKATAGGVTTTQGPKNPGDLITVTGYNAADKTNGTAVWNLYSDAAATIQVGQSKFSLNCTDPGMSGRDDCFLPQGDANAQACTVNGGAAACNNNWALEKITGSSQTLDCNALADNVGQPESGCEVPSMGGNVTYQYTVHNNTNLPVNITITDDKLGTIVGPAPVTLAPNNTQVYTNGPVNLTQYSINTGTVHGNTSGGVDQCAATDKAVVVPQCFLGNPQTQQLYPYNDAAHPLTSTEFNESTVLKGSEPSVATVGGNIRMYYSDEHALALGIRQVTGGPNPGTFPVTNFPRTNALMIAYGAPSGTLALSSGIDHNGNPVPAYTGGPNLPLQTGADTCPGGCDPFFRPVRPSLFCTDITNANTNNGDWQIVGGTGQPPHFVSGTWKSATTTVNALGVPTTTVDADPQDNDGNTANWIMGPDAIPPLGGYGVLPNNEKFAAEIRWNVNLLTCNGIPLQAGHAYRMQFLVHDGDQNKVGGDAGQACAIVVLP